MYRRFQNYPFKNSSISTFSLFFFSAAVAAALQWERWETLRCFPPLPLPLSQIIVTPTGAAPFLRSGACDRRKNTPVFLCRPSSP